MESKRDGTYIGVTGFMDSFEVQECLKAFRPPSILEQEGLLLMVGVLVSSTTLKGGTNRWFGRYPTMAAVPHILNWCNDPHALCTIHYNTDEPETLEEQVARIIDIGQGRIHALQLNMRWPSPVMLQRIKRRWPELRLILQMGHKAIADVTDGDEVYIQQAMGTYAGTVHDFLLDPSGGLGIPLSVKDAMRYMGKMPKGVRCGVAGGLAADNVSELEPLFLQQGVCSTDAEGRLRTLEAGGGKLLIPAAQAYIARTLEVMARAWAIWRVI